MASANLPDSPRDDVKLLPNNTFAFYAKGNFFFRTKPKKCVIRHFLLLFHLFTIRAVRTLNKDSS